jgi:hypothetical protein
MEVSHSSKLKCSMVSDHVTLNLNSCVSAATVLLGTEKAFHTACHHGLL